MIYVLGGAGFVGSAYLHLFENLGVPARAITRENYDTFRGTSCDVLVNANGNSKKFLSARSPLWDFDASVRSVAASLQDFHANDYIFLSSGDVYPNTRSCYSTREDDAIDVSRISRYGLHKYLAENLVRGAHSSCLIVRMGGFVGAGLKKNAIFDILTGAPIWLSPDSELQFIDTFLAARLVWDLISSGVRNEVVNLGGEGLLNIGAFHKAVGSTSVFNAEAPSLRYELSLTKLRSLLGLRKLPQTHECVMRFVDAVHDGQITIG